MDNELARALSAKIKIYTEPKRRQHDYLDSESTSDPEYTWGASYFCGEILAHVYCTDNYSIDLPQLLRIHNSYTQTNKNATDPQKLIEMGWLREVFGIILIPSVIKQAADHAQKIRDFGREIFFFDSLFQGNRTAMPWSDFEQEIANYEKENGVRPDIERSQGIFYGRKEDKAELYDLGISKSVYNHLQTLLFIHHLYTLQQDAHLQISKADLERIHHNHSDFFAKTPALQEMITKGMFTVKDNGSHYILNLWYNELKLRDYTRDKYAAIYWERLQLCEEFADNTERLHTWYLKIVHRQGFIHIGTHFTATAQKDFLNAAMMVITKDTEATYGIIEYKKLMLDPYQNNLHLFPYYFSLTEEKEYYSPVADLYVMYQQINSINHDYNDDLMFHSGSRRPLAYLIGEIVEFDKSHRFELIKQLLDLAALKPYVFWHTTEMIMHWRPEILPFLGQTSGLESVSMLLSLKLNLTRDLGESANDIKQELGKELFSFILKTLSLNPAIDLDTRALRIFQTLLTGSYKRFENLSGSPIGRESQKRAQIKMSTELRAIFESAELPGTIHSDFGRYKEKLYPSLLEGILTNTVALPDGQNGDRGYLSLPYIKLELLTYIIQLATSIKPQDGRVPEDDFINRACQEFCRSYSLILNTEKVAKTSIDINALVPTTPYWIDQPENNELLDLGTLLLYLNKNAGLQDFLSGITFNFSTNTKIYDEHNTFTAKKLRTHLMLLIRTYNNLYLNKSSIHFAELKVSSVLATLEGTITNYLRRYSVCNPTQKRYDIFNAELERGYWTSKKEELLPAIGNTLNRFSRENRQSVIEELLQTDQLMRSLKLLDYIISQEERQRLLAFINGADWLSHLENLKYSDLQLALGQLAKEPAFIEHTEAAIEQAELKLSKIHMSHTRHDDKLTLFRTKLLIAYQKGDHAALEAVPDFDPAKTPLYGISSRDEKDFYKALLFLEADNGEAAYTIFNKQLSYSDVERPTLALNRFASKLRWADKETKKLRKEELYRQALEEWDNFDSSTKNKEYWSSINEKITYNKLWAYGQLDEDQKFDTVFNGLEKELQLRPDFLKMRLTALMNRNMDQQARELLFIARQFHQLKDGDYPDFINEMDTLTQTKETIDYLTMQYQRIFKSAPEHIVSIIPNNINSADELPLFLFHEIIQAANDMLQFINSISTIDFEDKYTDLLMLSLNSRLVNYQWHAANLRGGFADPKEKERGGEIKTTNPGEIDLGIITSAGRRLAIGEAMILEGRNTGEVQKHNLKIFNYDHSRKLFFVIVYYRGEDENFNRTWDSYCDIIEDYIEFPPKFGLSAPKVQVLDCAGTNDSIKSGKSEHGTATIVYHLFINLHYHQPLKKKKVRSSDGKTK